MSKPVVKFRFSNFQTNNITSHNIKQALTDKKLSSINNQVLPTLKEGVDQDEYKKQKQNDKKDTTKSDLNNTPNKTQKQMDNNTVFNNSPKEKVIERLKREQLHQFQVVVQDPIQSDFPSYVPNPNIDKKEQKQIKKKNEEKKKDQQNQIQQIPIKKDQTEKKKQDNIVAGGQKKKYTFMIVPSHDETEQACCNLFGICDKQIQATYPIAK